MKKNRLLLLSGKNTSPLLLGKRYASHERRHERYQILGRLQGYIVHEDGRMSDVILSDISKSGLSYFVSMEDVAHSPNSTVTLKIAVADTGQIIECAFTLRDRRIDARGLYRHGLQVASTTKDMQALLRLEEFVRRPQLLRVA